MVNLSLPVIAIESENGNTILYEFDIVNMALTVKGNLDLERASSNVILRFIDSEENTKFVLQEKSKFSQDEKSVEYIFNILLPENLESGDYNIKVSCEEINKALEISFQFNGYDRILKALKEVDEARTTKTVGSVISGNIGEVMASEILGITTKSESYPYSIEDYMGLKSDGKIAFEEIMDNYIYFLPENFETDENKERILDELDAFLLEYRDGIASGKFADIKDSAAFEKWYNDYYELYEFNSPEKEAPDIGITDIVKATKDEENFIKRVSEQIAPMSVDEIRSFIYESAVLSYIKTNTPAEVQSLLLKYDDSGMIFDGFDTSGFMKLSLDEQEEVVNSFCHVHYSTKDAAIQAINDLINPEAPNEKDDVDTGRGGTRGPAASFPNAIPDELGETDIASKISFQDLDDVEWAREAIEYLAEHGIVNGKNEDIFAPGENITRAEFVKMIMSVLGVSDGINETVFTDVSLDAWYAPYVHRAYDNGLVLGDENGCFYPEANITREDIAVILYRMVNQNYTVKASLAFSDADNISDYAREAVAHFSERGIITGFVDGSFGPQKNATRAEAAVMLYRLISNKNK